MLSGFPVTTAAYTDYHDHFYPKKLLKILFCKSNPSTFAEIYFLVRMSLARKIVRCSFTNTNVDFIANEPAERRRSAGEVAENSAARRMLYAEKFSNDL